MPAFNKNFFAVLFALCSIFIDRKDYEITMPREDGKCFSSVRKWLKFDERLQKVISQQNVTLEIEQDTYCVSN